MPARPLPAVLLLLKRPGSFLLSLTTWKNLAAAFCEELNPISVHEAWPRNALWMLAGGRGLWMLAG